MKLSFSEILQLLIAHHWTVIMVKYVVDASLHKNSSHLNCHKFPSKR